MRLPHPESRAVFARVISILLTLSAALGGIAILSVIAGMLLGVRPVIVISGSMAPVLPVGAMAFTREAPASSARVGDIVTVPRSDGAGGQITHRVLDATTTGGVTTLRLKGDANQIEDPVPYRVEHVGQFLFQIPGLGAATLVLRTPMGLLVLGLYVAAMLAGSFAVQQREKPQAPTPVSATETSRPTPKSPTPISAGGRHRLEASPEQRRPR